MSRKVTVDVADLELVTRPVIYSRELETHRDAVRRLRLAIIDTQRCTAYLQSLPSARCVLTEGHAGMHAPHPDLWMIPK